MTTKARNTTRGATTTSSFGAGRREAHDATAFYERFTPPAVSRDDTVRPTDIDGLFVHGDARAMSRVPDDCVALVVTSPPYFAGKEYELALGAGGIPSSYLEYLGMLRDVFAECVRKLEAGGRIAVNVANLGRRPYRSLSADVIGILQDDLGLLLRGEVVWVKARGQSGSCAWGTYRSAANPTMRDMTERIVIASKGRFDRAVAREERAARGLPGENTLTADEFMEATLDVWEIATVSAKQVGHPAPFPVELPRRVIELFTYRGDLVLDPFMGSGSTAVAAARTGRRVAGYDTDAAYVALTVDRFAQEGRRPGVAGAPPAAAGPPQAAAGVDATGEARSKTAKGLARTVVEEAGFEIVRTDCRISGVPISIAAKDRAGMLWYFDVTGAFTSLPRGLSVSETLWKSLGKAAVMERAQKAPLVFLTSSLPQSGGELDRALRAAGPALFLDAIRLLEDDDRRRLGIYARGGMHEAPLPGFWS